MTAYACIIGTRDVAVASTRTMSVEAKATAAAQRIMREIFRRIFMVSLKN